MEQNFSTGLNPALPRSHLAQKSLCALLGPGRVPNGMGPRCSGSPCSGSRHPWEVFLMSYCSSLLFLFPRAQKRTESPLWHLVLWVHSLAGTQVLPGDAQGPLQGESSPSVLSVHIRKPFQRAPSFCSDPRTLWWVTVHDTQLASCSTTQNSFWQQLLVWPVAGAGIPCAGLQGAALCLPAGNRVPSPPALMCLFPFSICLPQEMKQHGDGCLGLRQAIFRSKEARCSSDWRQFHLCKMQFQCWKLWEFNRALEDFNIYLKIIWQVLKQQHYFLSVSQALTR